PSSTRVSPNCTRRLRIDTSGCVTSQRQPTFGYWSIVSSRTGTSPFAKHLLRQVLDVLSELLLVPVRSELAGVHGLQRIDHHQLHVETAVLEPFAQRVRRSFGILRLDRDDLHFLLLTQFRELRQTLDVYLDAGGHLDRSRDGQIEAVGEVGERFVE